MHAGAGLNQRADGPGEGGALGAHRGVLGQVGHIEHHVHRLDRGGHAQLGIARQVLGLHGLVVLDAVAQALLAVLLLRVLEGVQHEVDGLVADGVDAHGLAGLGGAQDAVVHALRVLGGLAGVAVLAVGVGLLHPGGVVGAHTVDELLVAAPLDLGAGVVVLGLDLLIGHGLEVEEVGVEEGADGEGAVAREVCEDVVGVLEAHEGGVHDAHGGDAQLGGVVRDVGEELAGLVHRGVVDGLGKAAGGVVGQDAGEVAFGVAQELAALRILDLVGDA